MDHWTTGSVPVHNFPCTVVLYIFLFLTTSTDCLPFCHPIWSAIYMRKYVLYWHTQKKKMCLALVSVVSNTVLWRVSYSSEWCVQCAHCNIEAHPPNIVWYVHCAYNREDHFHIQPFAMHCFVSYNRCHGSAIYMHSVGGVCLLLFHWNSRSIKMIF